MNFFDMKENKGTIALTYKLAKCQLLLPRTYLYHTTFANNTICDISIKHFGWGQIPRLGIDWG